MPMIEAQYPAGGGKLYGKSFSSFTDLAEWVAFNGLRRVYHEPAALGEWRLLIDGQPVDTEVTAVQAPSLRELLSDDGIEVKRLHLLPRRP